MPTATGFKEFNNNDFLWVISQQWKVICIHSFIMAFYG
jgi:hypothetical protein